VLKTSNNFPTQLSITEILRLNRQSHRTAILLKCLLPLCWCKPVKAAPDRAVKLAVEPLIHNTCLKIWERDKCDVRAGTRMVSPTKAKTDETDNPPLKIGKAATLVMLQPSAPARELTAWIYAPSQPLV